MKCYRLFAGPLLVFLAATLLACSTPEEKKEKHYLRALEYLKIADEKAAIIELRNAIQLDAKFAAARYQLGLLHLKTGNPPEAFAELQRAFSLDPKNADAGVKVAEFFLLSKKTEESRSSLQQVLEANPDYPDAVALLANLDLADGSLEKAAEHIDRAIRLSPENDRYYGIKGRILSAQKKWDEGEQAYKRAIELKPDSFTNYRTLLISYEQRGDEKAMRRLLDVMTPKFPEEPQLQLLHAGLYQKKGEWEKAEKCLLQAVEMKKDVVSYRLRLIDFYKAREQYETAEEYLKKSLAEIPNEIQLQTVLAELLFDREKYQEAQELLNAIFEKNAANGAANLVKARFRIKDGRNEEAEDILTPLTRDYPRWGEPYYYLALTQLRLGKVELALKAVGSAVLNTPRNDRFHTLAAHINLLHGNGVEAGREAAMALQINRRNFSAVKILAQSLVLQKAFDKTIKLVASIDKKIVDQDVELLGAIGMAYLGRNDRQAAEAAFSRILEIAPGNTRALSILTALTAGDNLDQSVAFVKQHIHRHETGDHYLLLGEMYVKKQESDLALQAFLKAQELSPQDPQAYIMRARLLHRLGKSDESVAQYNELLAREPQSVAALMGLATAFESQGKYAEAMAAYRKILEVEPDFAAAANNLAWLIANQEGDLGEALRLAMQAKQAMPDQPNIADTLGWVHYKRESYNLAISQFKHALESRPDDPTICFHLALAQYAVGEKSEAIALLQEVVAQDRQFTERNEAHETLRKWQSL